MSGFSLNAEGLSLIDAPANSGPTTNPVTPSQGGTGIVNNDASTLTISGAHATTLTVTGTTGVTLPTSGTLATLAGSEALTNKTLNGLTVTSSNGTLTIVNGSTLATSGAFATTLTATNTTNVTLPTTGTLATLAGTESLSNKTLTYSTFNIDTWANIIATSPTTGMFAYASDLGTQGTLVRYNGTNWRPTNRKTVLKTFDASSSAINAGNTIVFSYTLPASVLKVGDRIRVTLTVAKSAATQAGNIIAYVGTAGTTSDATINVGSTAIVSAGQRTDGYQFDLRVVDSTHLQLMGVSSASVIGYGAAGGASARAASVILASSATTASSLIISIGINGGASDTLTLDDCQLELITSEL